MRANQEECLRFNLVGVNFQGTASWISKSTFDFNPNSAELTTENTEELTFFEGVTLRL